MIRFERYFCAFYINSKRNELTTWTVNKSFISLNAFFVLGSIANLKHSWNTDLGQKRRFLMNTEKLLKPNLIGA